MLERVLGKLTGAFRQIFRTIWQRTNGKEGKGREREIYRQ